MYVHIQGIASEALYDLSTCSNTEQHPSLKTAMWGKILSS